jgi:hypothetical protein
VNISGEKKNKGETIHQGFDVTMSSICLIFNIFNLYFDLVSIQICPKFHSTSVSLPFVFSVIFGDMFCV